MRHVLVAIALFCSACSLLDGYDPCPGERAEAPGPDGPPDPGDPSDPGEYGADGARYKRLPDGTVCACGAYTIGCYDTPEEAEDAAACGYDMWGERVCAQAAPAPSADTSEPVRKWRCPYRWRVRSRNDWSDDVRIRQAQNYRKANLSHFQWCAQKSDDYWEYKCSDCNTTPVP